MENQTISYSVNISDYAVKQLQKLDKVERSIVKIFLTTMLSLDNPRKIGKPLKGNLKNHWRYRVGKLRIICIIIDSPQYEINVLTVENRNSVYTK